MLRRYSSLMALSGLLLGAIACGGSSQRGVTDTRTNWLTPCESEAECGSALSCLCGACTRSCENASDCSDLSEEATCGSLNDACEAGQRVCMAQSSPAATTAGAAGRGGAPGGGKGGDPATSGSSGGGTTGVSGGAASGGTSPGGTSPGGAESGGTSPGGAASGGTTSSGSEKST